MATEMERSDSVEPSSRSAVVLVNWNGWRDTLECLASLMRLEHPPLHVFVVDNASPNDSAAMIELWCKGEMLAEVQRPIFEDGVLSLKAPADLRWAVVGEGDDLPAGNPAVIVIRSAINRGFAGGNNVGIRLALHADVDFVWLLNTDTVVAPDSLDALIERAQTRPDAGMVGSSLIYYWRPNNVQALGGARFDMTTGCGRVLGSDCEVAAIPADPSLIEAQTDYVVGASMLVTRKFLEVVGPMCEDYFLYFEEIDWAERARGRFAMAYAPRSLVYHKVGGSSRKEASRLSLRYLYRNRIRFMARFFPQSLGSVKRHLMLNFIQHLVHGRWDDVLEIAGALLRAPRLSAHDGQR